MSLSRKKCCVPGCMESGSSQRTLHTFPNPENEKTRFNQWIYSIGGDIIGCDNEYIYKYRSVCHGHFEEKYCCRYNRLSNIAIPTLNLPGPMFHANISSGVRRPMRQIQNIPEKSSSEMELASTSSNIDCETLLRCPDEPSRLECPAPQITPINSTGPMFHANISSGVRRPMRQIQNIPEKSSSEMELASTSSNIDCETLLRCPDEPSRLECPAPQITPINSTACRRKPNAVTKIAKQIRITRPEKKLRSIITKLHIKLSKYKNRVKKQSASLKAASKITSNPALLAAMEKMSTNSKIITLMQFRELNKKTKGRRFTLQEKFLALSMFKQTPRAYRFLRKIFILPAPQTLAKLIAQADLKPGINTKIFTQLKKVSQKMSKEEKLCILIFDEMHLKANLSYNERKDTAIGFASDGEETKQEFADHVQVYMIRGLIKNYKQAVTYSFSAKATSGAQIAKELKRVIGELQEAGQR